MKATTRFSFRQNDTQIYSFIAISYVWNNLKVFFLVHNRELVHRVLITLILYAFDKQRNSSSFAKGGEILISKMRFANFAAICELILMVFLRHKLLCCNLQLSLQKNWLSFSTFFQSILMQSNSISAKIAILSLIWRSNHQRWCCWIYWPYVRDIRPALRGVASL